jgi:hypothetical protein
LNLALKTTQRVFEGFSLLKSHLSQPCSTPVSVCSNRITLAATLVRFSRTKRAQVKSILSGRASPPAPARGAGCTFYPLASVILL